MTKRIIYNNDEGGISIIIPTIECGLTIEQIAEKDVPIGKQYRIIDTVEIPSDRAFRNAWEENDGIKVNMPKAIEIQKEKIRVERKPLLEALDIEYMKALEVQNEAKIAEVASEKQRLRDITLLDSLINAKSADELKSINCETRE